MNNSKKSTIQTGNTTCKKLKSPKIKTGKNATKTITCKATKTVCKSKKQPVPVAPIKDQELSVNEEGKGDAEISFRNQSDFDTLVKNSEITQDLEECTDLVFMSRKEKQSLEEIKNITSLARAPLDDRQMIYYNRDVEKFSSKAKILAAEVSSKELNEAAGIIKEPSSNILASEVKNVASYLLEIKNLITQREMNWATAKDTDYAQKVEIMRLKSEVNHLRIICSRRESEIEDKDKLITDKDNEIGRLNRLVQKLKVGIINLERNSSEEEQPKNDRKQKIEELLRDVQGGILKAPKVAIETRKNLSPAAQLANAIHQARIVSAGVNF